MKSESNFNMSQSNHNQHILASQDSLSNMSGLLKTQTQDRDKEEEDLNKQFLQFQRFQHYTCCLSSAKGQCDRLILCTCWP